MNRFFGAWVLILMACGSLLQEAVAQSVANKLDSLDRPCSVDWVDVPLAHAMDDLADRLGLSYVLDSSVTEAMFARPIQLRAHHLTGRQAFRWTARVAGLDAIWVDGAMLVAVPERLPRTWQRFGTDARDLLAGGERAGGDGQTNQAMADRLTVAGARRVDFDWVDVSLGQVIRDVSAAFGVDVVFHPAITAENPLIRLRGVELNLRAFRR
ncbi:MAG: hypothetical protein FWC56_01660, partial [Phycisphaerae bacterium]|nr:hypothetical protein [Phycisphaerae bacterium]